MFVAHGGFLASEGGDAFHCLTVVAQLRGNTESDPSVMPFLLGAVLHVRERHQVFDFESVRSGISALFGDLPSACVSAIVALPTQLDAFSLDEVNAVLAALRNNEHLCVRNLVVVAEDPAAWQALAGHPSYVRTKPGGLADTTLALYQTLSTVMAPHALAEADTDDIWMALGTAQEPSEMVRGNWSPTTSKVELSDVDEGLRVLRRTEVLVVTSVGGNLPVVDARSMSKAWKDLASTNAIVVANHSVGHFRPGAAQKAGTCVALCRPLQAPPHEQIAVGGQ